MNAAKAKRIALIVEPGTGHSFPGHPESPTRFDFLEDIVLSPLAEDLTRVAGEPASMADILRVHSERYVASIEAALSDAPTYLDYGDTYVTNKSLEMALRSAGGVLAVLQAVLDGQAATGIALARPPGHHATAGRAMGFCLLNNVAIAARAAQAAGASRIAIIDFDVHHGNGTQAIFDPDPDVLYISTHQAGIFPGTGSVDERGSGDGLGSTINLPFPALAGDRALEAAAERIIVPAVERHRPELILVSAGFDAHWRDPLASLQFTSDGFHHLTQTLCALADGQGAAGPVLCLEGGYEPEALAYCVSSTLRAMLELPSQPEPWTHPDIVEPDIHSLLDLAASVNGL